MYFFYVLFSVSVNLEENSAAAMGLEKVNFNSNPQKGNAEECSAFERVNIDIWNQ